MPIVHVSDYPAEATTVEARSSVHMWGFPKIGDPNIVP